MLLSVLSRGRASCLSDLLPLRLSEAEGHYANVITSTFNHEKVGMGWGKGVSTWGQRAWV